MRIGFVGLGNMGEPIAQNLLKGGNELLVYNRTKSKTRTLEALGAKPVDSIASAADADFVFTMLSDDSAVEPASREILAAMPASGIHISLSTVSVQLSRRLHEQYCAKSRHFVAAPVFGRPPAAKAAQLVLVVAGEQRALEKCEGVLELIGRKVVVVGQKPEQANLVKLAGNFMIAAILESLGEASALVRKAGMQQDEFLGIISGDLFPSPILKAYTDILSEDRFVPAGFAMELGLKDMRLVLAAADELCVPMPAASLVRDNFLTGLARGKGQSDWSALAEIASENAGVKPFNT